MIATYRGVVDDWWFLANLVRKVAGSIPLAATYGPWASPSLVVACMTWCEALRGCLAAKFNFCSSLLSSVHTLLVNILRCVRLYVGLYWNEKYYH